MRVIIIGAGKVGYSMAQILSGESHDVFLIEADEVRARQVDESLDISVIHGSGSSIEALHKAAARDADLLLAVTQYDELNMVACMLARRLGVKKTVARVRNTEYVEADFLGELMAIDLFINPEQVTAQEIAKIVRFPESNSVEYYAQGQVQLNQITIPEDSPVCGKTLMELDNSVPYNILSIARQRRLIVPRGKDQLLAGDRIALMAKSTDMQDAARLLGITHRKAASVTILGGGRTGFYLAQMLEKVKPPLDIKVIEQDMGRAREIAERLDHSLVICGDAGNYDILEEENIGSSDICVAVTSDDRINLLCSLIARNLGARKTIAQIKRLDVMPLIEQIGIDTVLSPRSLAAGAILKYIRRGDIISVTMLN
ncbi:MAG: Trk system potassium transporter TrkA, partial [Syntrophomonadaceae bacterium]|nr:Trk system potassium transporter TrkA [Syntrophomonadaceae bacterium]